eukprot:1847020-Rhodomonas_salina.1
MSQAQLPLSQAQPARLPHAPAADETSGGVVDYLGAVSAVLGDGIYELDGITRVFVSHMASHTRGRGLRVGALVRLMHVVPIMRGGDLEGFGKNVLLSQMRDVFGSAHSDVFGGGSIPCCAMSGAVIAIAIWLSDVLY